MATYNKKTVEKIVSLIEDGNYSISTICRIVGIGRKTFYDWRNTRPEFMEAIMEAEQRRLDELYELANQALRRKLEGYQQTVSRTVYVPSEDDPQILEIKQHVVTTKFYEPDMRALMEVLGGGNGKKKQKGMRLKNTNPALIVKRNEEQVKRNVSQVPPFTIRAKEVVEQTMPPAKQEEKQEEISQEISSDEMAKRETPRMDLKEGGKDWRNEDQMEKIEKKEEPYVSSTSDPLPPGYTRRG